jgi:hypothetical protein
MTLAYGLCSFIKRPSPSPPAPIPTSARLILILLVRSLTNQFTMYRISWTLLALFPLILPIIASPVPVPEEIGDLEKRDVHTGGRVYPSRSPSARGANFCSKGTFFTPGLGSCGETNTSDQVVVALSEAIINTAVDCGKVW